jgi:hypothetical protein
MRKALVGIVLAASLPFAMSGAALAGAVFSDGTFDLTNYSESSPYYSTSTATFSQCASCGLPGTALDIKSTVTDPFGVYAQGFVNNTFTYDPATQGTITGISASVDKDISVTYGGIGFTNTFHPLILQDGNYYLASIHLPNFNLPDGGGSTGYESASGSLIASDFQKYDFTTGSFVTGTPDFSGDQMWFGLAQISGSATGSLEVYYDNLSLAIETPEPISLSVFGAGLAAAAAMRRRRKRPV